MINYIVFLFRLLISKIMDKKWMSSNRVSKEYENGVLEFVKFVVEHAENPS